LRDVSRPVDLPRSLATALSLLDCFESAAFASSYAVSREGPLATVDDRAAETYRSPAPAAVPSEPMEAMLRPEGTTPVRLDPRELTLGPPSRPRRPGLPPKAIRADTGTAPQAASAQGWGAALQWGGAGARLPVQGGSLAERGRYPARAAAPTRCTHARPLGSSPSVRCDTHGRQSCGPAALHCRGTTFQ